MVSGSQSDTSLAGERRYYYRTRLRRGHHSRWISLVQWVAFVLWVLFSYWLLMGSGFRAAVRAMRVYHGIYAFQVALSTLVLPNWGLVTMAVAMLIGWMQVIWVRYGQNVVEEHGLWLWTGRSGPAKVEKAARTAGGVWCLHDRRWYYVGGGLVDDESLPWWKAACRDVTVRIHPLRLLSPVLLLLVGVGLCTYVLERPVMAYKKNLHTVRRGVFSSRPAVLNKLIKRHPEFLPLTLYLSTLPACTKVDCMKAQIVARLEMRSIGPSFSAGEYTLINLLVLNGKGKLAMKLLGPHDPRSFDIAVRLGDIALAQKMLADDPQMKRWDSPTIFTLFLLQEGRYEEAFEFFSDKPMRHSHNMVTEYAVAAYLSGHCRTAEEFNEWLLYPDRQAGVNLQGRVSSMGLGALQRVARAIKRRASYALGLAIKGDLQGSESEWREAVRQAQESGVPGLMDRDRILMRLLNPSALSDEPYDRSRVHSGRGTGI